MKSEKLLAEIKKIIDLELSWEEESIYQLEGVELSVAQGRNEMAKVISNILEGIK